jgi:cell division protein FtsW (lipid II flippase)
MGRPGRIPIVNSDFISAAIGEELGLVGLMAVIIVYAIIVMRSLRAAIGAREWFGKLLASGLGFVFALQVFAIIGGVTRLLPLTGLTTPFVSQGGSSLLANWVIIAILLRLSHQARVPIEHDNAAQIVSLEDDETVLLEMINTEKST